MISSFIYQKITIVPHSTERGIVVYILNSTYKFPVLPLSNFLDDFLLFEKITLIRCRGNGTEAPDFLNVLSREGIRQKLVELGSLVVGVTYLLITFLIDEKVLQHLTEQDLFITTDDIEHQRSEVEMLFGDSDSHSALYFFQ